MFTKKKILSITKQISLHYKREDLGSSPKRIHVDTKIKSTSKLTSLDDELEIDLAINVIHWKKQRHFSESFCETSGSSINMLAMFLLSRLFLSNFGSSIWGINIHCIQWKNYPLKTMSKIFTFAYTPHMHPSQEKARKFV